MKKSLWVWISVIVNLLSGSESVFKHDATSEASEIPSISEEEYVFSQSEEKEELSSELLESSEPERELNGFRSPDKFELFKSSDESKSNKEEKAKVKDQGHSYRSMMKSNKQRNNIMLNENKEDYSNIMI